MSIPALDAKLMQRGGDPDLVARELLWTIEQGLANSPRSLQKMIGPSEIGDECRRRLAYKLLGTKPTRTLTASDWKKGVGSGVHLLLADLVGAVEIEQGQERWAVETQLTIGEVNGKMIKGTCDVYDRVTATVVDWKTTSLAKLAVLRSQRRVPVQYRVQAHLYGRGWRRAGLPVDQVMLIFLPRDGTLADAYPWHEPYDDAVAVAALERLSGIATLVETFNDAALDMLPTSEAYCLHCPYLKINSSRLAEGCPGDPAMSTRAAALEGFE